MSQFNPPIQDKETDELIRIVDNPFDEWQEEARKEAEKELDKRNVSFFLAECPKSKPLQADVAPPGLVRCVDSAYI